ncbi:MAG TPA: CAP domain-containing protein [Thermoanaerobaculia bacterium]|nr:CAP domain-containing protein [Thermoanaerobaculia bacterium]
MTHFNQDRAHAGVLPFRPSPVLNQVAQQQADEMAEGWRLRPPSAALVAERLRRVGYSAHTWREDYLTYSSPGARPVYRWRKSGAALDGQFRDLGVGAARAEGGVFYVFLFGWHEGDFFAQATAGLMDRELVLAEMLARVNDFRRGFGLPPLAHNPLLDRVSQGHAEDMLRRSYFGHRTPEGLGPSDRARADGYRSGIGENIAEQRFSVREALDAWMGSLGHRSNILDPGCRELGLGLAVGEGYDAAPGGYRVVWVQSFGRGSAAPTTSLTSYR